jgi:hypothetical protein
MIQSEIMSNASAVTSRVSVPFQIDDLLVYSVQAVFTGVNVVGVLTLEATNDDTDSTSWTTIQDSTQAVIASANHIWNVNGAGYRWCRARWVYTSGTGNIKMNVTIKEPANRY